jgi:hypothetical protein
LNIRLFYIKTIKKIWIFIYNCLPYKYFFFLSISCITILWSVNNDQLMMGSLIFLFFSVDYWAVVLNFFFLIHPLVFFNNHDSWWALHLQIVYENIIFSIISWYTSWEPLFTVIVHSVSTVQLNCNILHSVPFYFTVFNVTSLITPYI